MSREELLRQLKSQDSKCYYCSKDISQYYEVDHFISLAMGGKHEYSNIVMACKSCNRRKNKLDGFSFFRKLGIDPPERYAA